MAESNGPDNLGKVLSVATQVVSGINYKIRFELPGGNEYEVVVYDQSWTKTRQLTSQRLITPTLDDINESP